MGLDSGRLDRRIELMADVPDRDEYGAAVQDAQVYATVWATVKEETGREILAAGVAREAQKTVVFTIRYRSDLKESHSIRWNGDVYDISHVREIQRRVGWEITAIRKEDNYG